MVLANTSSFGYRLFFLLHILSILVAFAPAFVWPIVNARLRTQGATPGAEIGKIIRDSWTRIHGPALVLAGLFGIFMVILSSKAWKFSQTWVSMAFLLWFLMLGVVFGLMPWNERKAAEGDVAADRRSAAFTGILHLLLLLMVVNMIWKPGL
ncbi:MAG: hypothetical protein JO291_15545 [Acidimicrobiia bacterium]|nr:hypothetical protein [Acidimicrobiia bacterium]